MTPDDLIGTWEMVSFVTTFEDGTTHLSYGTTPQGQITYTADGYMSAHLWDPDRHKPNQDVGSDPAYFSYCGRWKVEGSRVCHSVIAATAPAWAGTDVFRQIIPRDDQIELVAEGVVFGGKIGVSSILWRRT